VPWQRSQTCNGSARARGVSDARCACAVGLRSARGTVCLASAPGQVAAPCLLLVPRKSSQVPGAPGMRQSLWRAWGSAWVALSRTAAVCPAARGRAKAAGAACSLATRAPGRPRADDAREADGDVPEQPLLPHAAGRLADQPPAARGRHGRLRARVPGAAVPLHAARAPGAPGAGLRAALKLAAMARARLRGPGSRGHVGAWSPVCLFEKSCRLPCCACPAQYADNCCLARHPPLICHVARTPVMHVYQGTFLPARSLPRSEQAACRPVCTSMQGCSA